MQAHCERIGLPARVQRDPEDPGVYHLQPELREEPLVSIIIPTAGGSREIRYQETVLVTHCVRSIVEDSTYANLEIVVVADATTPTAVIAELEAIAGDRLRIVPFDRPFSFSAKINAGAVRSRGEHLLLLNDDMEVATPDWIERMVMYSSMPEVGAVGGRLLLEDGRIQHAGIGFQGGLPGHPYYHYPGDVPGLRQRGQDRPQPARRDRRLPDDPARAVRRGRRPQQRLPDQLQRRRLLPQAAAGGRRVVYDPDLRDVPLRVLQPLLRRRGVGEAAAARPLVGADRARPLLEPEHARRVPAPRLPLPLGAAPQAAAAAQAPAAVRAAEQLGAPV